MPSTILLNATEIQVITFGSAEGMDVAQWFV